MPHRALLPGSALNSSQTHECTGKQYSKKAEGEEEIGEPASLQGRHVGPGSGDRHKQRAYVADLICDFPDVAVDLQVRMANPLMEVYAVIELTDFLLRLLGSNHLYHVRHQVDFRLVLLIN